MMSSFNFDEMPPRPPLSVPFPLELGDEFHLGSATSLNELEKGETVKRSEDDRVPPPKNETGRSV